jgi:hypothetical protein
MFSDARSGTVHPRDKMARIGKAPSPLRPFGGTARDTLRLLLRDWCWVVVTGFLLYLGVFGFSLWYFRLAVPIGVLIVSFGLFRVWTGSHRARRQPH